MASFILSSSTTRLTAETALLLLCWLSKVETVKNTMTTWHDCVKWLTYTRMAHRRWCSKHCAPTLTEVFIWHGSILSLAADIYNWPSDGDTATSCRHVFNITNTCFSIRWRFCRQLFWQLNGSTQTATVTVTKYYMNHYTQCKQKCISNSMSLKGSVDTEAHILNNAEKCSTK